MLAVQADGARSRPSRAWPRTAQLHPLQAGVLASTTALQCGFCTPGILMSRPRCSGDNPRPTEDEIREALSGHLCRCTGYQGIVDAVLALVAAPAVPAEPARWTGRCTIPAPAMADPR